MWSQLKKVENFMKAVKIIYCIASVMLLFLLAYGIINTYVSLKYEIDQIRWFANEVDIDVAESYLRGQIEILYCFLCYVLINVVFLLVSICVKDKHKKIQSSTTQR